MMQAFLTPYSESGVCKLRKKQTVLWPHKWMYCIAQNFHRNVMISFIWSLRGQRLGTTVKHESLFPWDSIAVAVPTGLISTLDGNNVILTPRSLDHRGKTPSPPTSPSVRAGRGWFLGPIFGLGARKNSQLSSEMGR